MSGAGRLLGVKHTTVARRVQTLEEQLGSRLFDRSAAGYAMTQAAEDLYHHALAIEERTQAIDRQVFGLDSQLQGPLRLTGSHDLLTRVVVPQLPRFNLAYPGINVELLGSSGLVDLAARQADIALRLTSKPPDYLVGQEVLPLRHGIYGSQDYFRASRDTERVVLWGDERDEPSWVRENFLGSKVVLRTDEVTTMMVAVKSGLGLARMPCYMGDSDLELYRLDRPLVPSDWGVWVLSHVDLRSTARVRVCREFLVRILREQRELIEGLSSQYYRGEL